MKMFDGETDWDDPVRNSFQREIAGAEILQPFEFQPGLPKEIYRFSETRTLWACWQAAYEQGQKDMQNAIISRLGDYEANQCAQIAASIPTRSNES